MGWNISHGTDQHGEIRRSYTSVSNLGQQVAHVLPASDWRNISHLFGRRSSEPFTVPASEAGRVAKVLRKAAKHRLMPRDWAREAVAFADAADEAACRGAEWKWH